MTTTERADNRAAQSITCWASARPPNRCNTFGRWLFMRVPLPAAITTTSTGIDMNTSLACTGRGQGGGAGLRRIIARTLLVLGLTALLGACATTRLAYNQAPNLSYWWLDNHLGIDSEQTPQVRDDIDSFFDWHRREELPTYAGLLRSWQDMARRDVTADEMCRQFDTIRGRLVLASERMVEPLARLARQIGPAQLARLQRKQADSNEEFADDFIRGSREERIERRFERALSRTEQFYGRLSAAQKQLLREQIAASPWDARRTQAERQRRQADLLATVQRVQAEPERAEQAVREHLARLSTSPAADYQALSAAAIRHGCGQFAALHNSTTAEQRAQAVRVLQGYERDLEVLSAQR